jgi:hypothetical protein
VLDLRNEQVDGNEPVLGEIRIKTDFDDLLTIGVEDLRLRHERYDLLRVHTTGSN